MKQSGVHWGVLMQMARRGGMSGLPIILPGKTDGYVQAIRDKNISSEVQVGDSSRSFANAGLGVERQALHAELGSDVVEVEMEVGELCRLLR